MLFRKKRRREPWPDWLKWALIGFLALSFLGNMHKKNTPGALPQALHKAAETLNPQKLLPLEAYKNVLFPRYGAELRMKDIAPGDGAPAVCGQQVTLAYETYAADKPLDGGQTLLFRIGDGTAPPALEQGVVGMKPGGKRSLLSPPGMAYAGKAEAKKGLPPAAPVRFEIELLAAAPALPDADATPYRIANVAAGSGTPILCGEPVKARVTLWSVDGAKLFSSDDAAPMVFTPGKSEVSLGLEQGVIGMNRGGIRTLVVPPAFQKTMDGNAPSVDFPFPKAQTVLVDVETLP